MWLAPSKDTHDIGQFPWIFGTHTHLETQTFKEDDDRTRDVGESVYGQVLDTKIQIWLINYSHNRGELDDDIFIVAVYIIIHVQKSRLIVQITLIVTFI